MMKVKRPWSKHLIRLADTSNLPSVRLPLGGTLKQEFFSVLPEAFVFNDGLPVDLSDVESFDYTLQARPPFEYCAYEFNAPKLNQPCVIFCRYFEQTDQAMLIVVARDSQRQWGLPRYVLRLDYANYLGGGYAELDEKDSRGAVYLHAPGLYKGYVISSVEEQQHDVAGFRAMYGWPVPFFLSLTALLSCRNVERARAFRSPKAERTARAEDAYWELRVKRRDADESAGSRGPLDYARHAPRTHHRRGHVRHYRDHAVWIHPVIVNPGAGGTVTKDYVIL